MNQDTIRHFNVIYRRLEDIISEIDTLMKQVLEQSYN